MEPLIKRLSIQSVVFLATVLFCYYLSNFASLYFTSSVTVSLQSSTEGSFKIYFYESPGGYHEKNATNRRHLSAGILHNIVQPIPFGTLHNLRIDPIDANEAIALKNVSFKNVFGNSVTIPAEKILDYFHINNHVDAKVSNGTLILTPFDQDLNIILVSRISYDSSYLWILLVLGSMFFYLLATGAWVFAYPRRFLARNSDMLAGGLVFSIGVFALFPGPMSGDSLDQWRQVLTPDQINNFRPPSLVYLWLGLHKIWDGPHGLLVYNYLTYAVSLILFARIFFSAPLARVLFVLGIGLFPVTFYQVGALWKDSTMLGTVALSIALLLIFENKRKYSLLIISVLFLLLGMSVRFNAILIAFFYFLYLAFLLVRRGTRYRSTTCLVLTLMLTISTFIGITKFNTSLVKPQLRVYNMENFTFIPDLCGMSLILDKNIMPDYLLNDAGQELGLEFCRLYHTPYHNTIMWKYEYISNKIKTEHFPDKKFKQQYINLVTEFPLAYIKTRLALAHYTLGIKRSTVYQPFLFEIQQFPKSHYLHAIARPLHLKNKTVLGYSKLLTHYLYNNTILYQVWPYLALSIIQICIFLPTLCSSRTSRRALLLLSAGFFYWLPYLLIAPSAEFRFSSFTIFCTILVIPVTMSYLIRGRTSNGRLKLG